MIERLFTPGDGAVLELLAVVGVSLCACVAAASAGEAQPSPGHGGNVAKICRQPVPLATFLRTGRLADGLDAAASGIPAQLVALGLTVREKPPGARIRLGANRVPMAGQVTWRHFEGTDSRLWIDVVGFATEDTCFAIYDKSKQWHSGLQDPRYFVFMTIRNEEGMDAVTAIVRRGPHLLSAGVPIPFRVLCPAVGEGENTAPEQECISAAIDTLTLALRAMAVALVDPQAVTWIPPALPTEDEVRASRVADFVRLWSEVKYNFVFLDKRTHLDWDSVLDRYLPRVQAAQTQEEFVAVLKECVALLQDGHTWFGAASRPTDAALVNVEPVEGKPVVTAVGKTPEMQASGIVPGMQLTAVNGVPVSGILSQRIYPYVSASTPQDRDSKAFPQLLQGAPGDTFTASFLDLDGREHTARLVCDLSRHRQDVDWAGGRSAFEYRELSGGIAYVALNSFGSDQVAKLFDEHFARILAAKGLILDVRSNGGGNTSHGYAIIARLISEPCTQTSKWRSRQYVPVLRAWGQEQEWHMGDHGSIEPRGDRPFTGPVVVLIGPKTYSAAEDFLVPLKVTRRATLIGTPSGGSTGQPLIVNLQAGTLGICSKWDSYPDSTDFVGVGVQPDILVERSRQDVAAGRDPALERAVSWFAQH
ncbi:MAG: S41 family peptidase [Candidatus Latescibacterota bacterium]